MGPGSSSRDRSRRNGPERQVYVRSARVGEVPVFTDRTDPKRYKRLVFDWIRFQDLTDKDSSKKLSMGQQILTIITNIHGNAGQRLGNIPQMIHSSITRDEFVDIMDLILDVVDPQDRESSFLETAKAWKDLMAKGHGKSQSYDSYWSEYSSLCIHYAYSHGKAAQTAGVQELLALLCVLNSRLERTEFSMVLQNAIQNQVNANNGSSKGSITMGALSAMEPKSARQALAMGQRETIIENTSGPVAGEEGLPRAVSGSAEENLAKLLIALNDSRRQLEAAQGMFADIKDALSLVPAAADQLETLDDCQSKIQMADTYLNSCLRFQKKLQQSQEMGVHSRVNDPNVNEEELKPIITMESVRVALRRLDCGANALSHDSHRGDTIHSGMAVPQHIKCWFCGGNHYAYKNPKCKEGLRKRKEKEKADKAKSGNGASNGSGSQKDDAILSGLAWGDNGDTARSKFTLVTQNGASNIEDSHHMVVDGGAPLTVIGWKLYIEICDDLGTKPIVRKKKDGDPSLHAFGTTQNSSAPEKVMGRCTVPFPIGKGKWLPISALVINGSVPFIMGKDTLEAFKIIEDHGSGWVTIGICRDRPRLRMVKSKVDGHSRIRLDAFSARVNIAESLISQPVVETGDKEPSLVQRIHSKTHLHPKTVEILLKRAGKWDDEASEELKKVVSGCRTCLKSGEPRTMKKFSLSKFQREFNECIEMDIMYWGKQMALHIVDTATGYSELVCINKRKLEVVLRKLDNCWFLRHGCPEEVRGDQEFDKKILQKWMSDRGARFTPLPARRHNKAGSVERKNRVVKDVLEKLDHDKKHASFQDKLVMAQFASNILYGNKMMSSFEMVRGYTPSVNGSGQKAIAPDVLRAHQEMTARRLLATMLKSKPDWKPENDLQVGQNVLILLPGGKRPRGKWEEMTITAIRDEYSITVGSGRKKRVIAREDVRTLPKSDLADEVVRAIHDVPRKKDSEANEDSEDDRSDNLDAEERSISSEEQDKMDDEVHDGDGSDMSQKGATATEGEDDNDGNYETPKDSNPRRSGRKTGPPVRLTYMAVNPINREESEQLYLQEAYKVFQGGQFYRRDAPFLPPFIFDEANKKELVKNWVPNMERIRIANVPSGSNIIGSHFVYKLKFKTAEKDGEKPFLELKSRLCVHGNHDDERESIRTDAAVVSHVGFRLIYSFAVTNGFILGKADVRGAYTQSGEAKRLVYVKPPFKLDSNQCLWLLKATVYGIASAGRKWQRVSDEAMIKVLGLEMVVGMPQLFIKRDRSMVVLLIAKYVDDIIVAALNDEWLLFAKDGCSQCFEIGSWKRTPSELDVNGTEVIQDKEIISLTAKRLSKEVDVMQLQPARRKDISSEVSAMEQKKIRTMAGKLGYLGISTSPMASFAASFIQQLIPKMTIAGVKYANGIARDLLKRQMCITYIRPQDEVKSLARIVVFSDAGFPRMDVEKKVAQEGNIVGIAFGSKKGAIFHAISWISRKQRRVSNSSGMAETIAATTAVGCALNVQTVMFNITRKKLPITLVVDSMGLHRTLATQAQPRDSAMAAEVHGLRLDYEAKVLDYISWIEGKKNPSDCLTKPLSGETAGLMDALLQEGRLPVDVDVLRHYGPAKSEED